MMRPRDGLTGRRLKVVAGALATGLTLAGCGGDATGAASSSSPAAAGGPTSMPAGLTKLQQRDFISRQCMESKGWKGTVTSDGGVTYDAKGQAAALDQASQQCDALAGEQVPLPKPTAAQLKKLYAKELATVQCLRTHGFPTPDRAPSSEQQYVAEYLTATSWRAYENFPPEQLAAAEKVCPQPSLDL